MENQGDRIIYSSIISTLETYKGSLEANNLYMLNFTSSPTFHTVIQGNIVHEKRIEIEVESYV